MKGAILDFDLGNTRLKWRLTSSSGAARQDAVVFKGVQDLASLESVAGVERVRIASVVKGELFDSLLAWSRARWRLEPEIAQVKTEWAGVVQAYDDPSRLGVDRWLCLLAAHKYGRPAVVVSSGSAITVDLLPVDGKHLGGYIVPGLDMMRRALFAGTSAVRLDQLQAPPSLAPGRDTVEAVNAGLLIMACGLIEQAAQRLATETGEALILITGGAGEVLRAFLERESDYNPHLVLDGLALALP